MNTVLSALNNETRLQVILCLSKKPKSVSEMIAICGLSQSADISSTLQRFTQEVVA